MYKYSSRLNKNALEQVQGLWRGKRYQSTQRGLSGGQKGILVGTVVLGSGAGVLGYAGSSIENRKQVEKYIPGVSAVLTPVLGPIVEPPALKSESLLQKKLDRDAKRQELTSEKQPRTETQDKASSSLKGSMQSSPENEVTKDEVSPVTTAEEDVKVVSKSNEVKPEKLDNDSLTLKLQEAMLTTQQQVSAAVAAYEDLSASIQKYTEKVYDAINSDGERTLFEAASQMAHNKDLAIKLLENKMALVKQSLENLQSTATVGKETDLTKDNPTLSLVDKFISELNFAMREIGKDASVAIKESIASSELQGLVEQGRNAFEQEVKDLLPEVKLGEPLKEEQLAILLAHAHSKVMSVQKELAKLQSGDKRSHSESSRPRDHEYRLTEGRMHAEIDRLKHEMSLDHRHRVAQMRDDLENELRSQLKRQAAAHSDHLADMLVAQEHELDRVWENKLSDVLQNERDSYLKSLSSIDGQLKGLNNALEERAEADTAAQQSHELWLTCQTFKSSLRLGSQEELHPLKQGVSSIKQAAGKANTFVETVLGAISPKALDRGVYTESALRERFMKVERICRRVAMIDDNGGSLVKYFISYLRSFMLVGAFEHLPTAESQDEQLDLESLDTYDVLARTRYCLEKDDLLQSVRYMKLLRGEAKHVAGDWIQEALLTLEARQAADALMSFATATGVKAL